MKTPTKKEYSKKWTGVVEIKTGEHVAKLTSMKKEKDTDKVVPFPNKETSVKISLSDFDKKSLRVIKPNMESRKFRVRLNEDGDGVETVTPVSGLFPGKFVGLAKDQNGVPKLIVKTYNQGTKDENSHLEFIAMYEITSNPFKGVELPGYYLHYKFAQIPEDEEDGGMTQFDTQNTSKATQLQKLQAWGEVHGDVLDEPIAWNPDEAEVDNKVVEVYAEKHDCPFANILPTVEERILENDRDVDLVFENGNIAMVQAHEDYGNFGDESGEPDEDDIDKKFPAKEVVVAAEPVVEKKASKPATKKLPKKYNGDEDL